MLQRPRGCYPQANASTESHPNVRPEQETGTTNDVWQTSNTILERGSRSSIGYVNNLPPPYAQNATSETGKNLHKASIAWACLAHNQLIGRHDDRQHYDPSQPNMKIHRYQSAKPKDETRDDRTIKLFFRSLFPDRRKADFKVAYKLKYGIGLPRWVGKAGPYENDDIQPFRSETPLQFINRILDQKEVDRAVDWELVRDGPKSRKEGMEEYAMYHREWRFCYLDTSTLHWATNGEPTVKEYIIWRLRIWRNGFADEEERSGEVQMDLKNGR